ncbi:MAG TPA: hypothetical protein VM900_00155 [Sphingomonas sp.]|jgi:hypothetical protein|nr:hypothetical protein [Sphingomonas sp.]
MLGSAKIGSLSSSLLARKGQARPAMRSQGFGGFSGVGQGLEDLGWNDMGVGDAAPMVPEPVAVPVAVPAPVAVEAAPDVVAPVPQVLVERETLKELIAAPAVVKSVSVATATRLRRETAHAGKAAFTLRLDAERHLRLRLTSAVTNRSAQQLVIEALDALLQSVSEVDALVAQLPPATRKR